MLQGLFHLAQMASNLAGATVIPESDVPLPERRPETPENLQTRIRQLESNLAKALMINEALWEILRDKLSLTDADLNEKLYQIDMRDGNLDGKNQRGAIACPKCQRMVSARHGTCLYCGEVVDTSVFRLQ